MTLPTVELEGVSSQLAALVVGVTAGLLVVGGAMATMLGCEWVRGTSTCGGTAGVFLFLAVAAIVVDVGAAGLRIAGVAYPGTISFLGVGLVVVVVLLGLLEVIFSIWMLAVIPALSGAAFVLAHALSGQFGDWSGPEWR